MNRTKSAEYLRDFQKITSPMNAHRAALEEARENRKFEIELYWKRAAYFWVFIAAAFGGYSTLPAARQGLAFLIASLGFIFSLAWYFVNRGSKFWQQNWELHVDLLEDDIAGPVYKTVIQREQSVWYNLNGAYPFSVSKINHLLSLFVTVAWIVLISRSLIVVWEIHLPISTRGETILMLACTLAAAIILGYFGKTRDLRGDTPVDHFYRSKRTYD